MTRSTYRLALASAAVLALTAGAAQAADLRRAPAPIPMAEAQPVYPTLWTGLTFGAHVGYGWADVNSGIGLGGDADGGIAGLQLGYNWQSGAWVFGIEGDIAWTGMDGGGSGLFDDGDDGFYTANVDAQINWLSTLRGRIGYAPDRWQIYATGGIAFADMDIDYSDDFAGPFSASDSNVHFGWTIGAGVDYALTENWRLGLEYKYLDFGKETYNFGDAGSTKVDFDMHHVSLRLNYKF